MSTQDHRPAPQHSPDDEYLTLWEFLCDEMKKRPPTGMRRKATRYPWHDAPEWAQWAATDANGSRCRYEFEPYLLGSCWAVSRGRSELIGPSPGDNWTDSLERRPQGGEVEAECPEDLDHNASQKREQIFWGRLKSLLDEKQILLPDLTEATGISPLWGDVNLGLTRIDDLAQIATYFNVSIDWLLGRTDVRGPEVANPVPRDDEQIFADELLMRLLVAGRSHQSATDDVKAALEIRRSLIQELLGREDRS